MYHMLKSLGFNVEEIESVAKQLPLIVTGLADRLERIEAKLDIIAAHLQSESEGAKCLKPLLLQKPH